MKSSYTRKRYSHISRRDFLKLSALLSAGMLLTGCGGHNETPAPTLDRPEITPATTPQPPKSTATGTAAPTATTTPTEPATSTALPPTLRTYADQLGKEIGAEALAGGSDPLRMEILAREFNQLTITAFTWPRVRPNRETFVLDIPKGYARRAHDNGQIARAHSLIWGNSNDVPDEHWLKQKNYSKAELIEIMQTHIRTVMSDPGLSSVQEWVVVNEGAFPYYFWGEGIGPEYIEIAFQTAREANPTATLIYNDYGFELPGMFNEKAVYKIVQNLKQKELIDGVGMQMHFLGGKENPDPNMPIADLKQGLITQLQKYSDLGVPVYITEMDIDAKQIQLADDEKEKRVVEIFRTVAELCVQTPGYQGLTVWGMNSEDSWPTEMGGEGVLLFSNNKPLPTYDAVLDVFAGRK